VADCAELAQRGSRVRLVKGAYREPATVAHQSPAQVSEAYLECLEALISGGGYAMIATHDPAMISGALDLVRRHGLTADNYEFQMLFGVRPAEQLRLAGAGHRVRVYVPYGTDWWGYFMRRLAERPANLALFLRALSSRR
jgi:proline dehydrogenase